MTSVKNYDTWILAYKDRKQPTLQMRPTDGALLVVDAKDPSKVLREFPVRRGDDLLSLLQTSGSSEEIRKLIQTIHTTRNHTIEVAKEEMQRVEKELLSKIEERRSVKDPLPKLELTRTIGTLQNDLAKASEILQNAIIPLRYVVETMNVAIAKSLPYTFEERSIPIAKKKV